MLANSHDLTSHEQISAYQIGFNDRLDNFDLLISQFELIPEYAPNESDINILTIKILQILMDCAGKAVLAAENSL